MRGVTSYLLLIFCLFFLCSCATTKIVTDLGTDIGQTYQEAYIKGSVSAEESIKAWPYISGNIKGIMSSNYDIELPELMKQIITDLDSLSSKETKEGLTEEEKGFVIGSFVRLEHLAIQYGWDKYGVNILNWVLGM